MKAAAICDADSGPARPAWNAMPAVPAQLHEGTACALRVGVRVRVRVRVRVTVTVTVTVTVRVTNRNPNPNQEAHHAHGDARCLAAPIPRLVSRLCRPPPPAVRQEHGEEPGVVLVERGRLTISERLSLRGGDSLIKVLRSYLLRDSPRLVLRK